MEKMINKYYDVFKDVVKNYIEEYNENSNDKIDLTDRETKRIAHDLIFSSENLWEYFNEHIDYEIGKILRERESDK